MMKAKVGLSALVLLLLFSCGLDNRISRPYGTGLNQRRSELGIPLVEQNWLRLDKGETFEYWSSRQNRMTTSEPEHRWKRIYLKEGAVVQEEDVFHYEGNANSHPYRLISRWFPKIEGDSLSFRFIKYFRDSFPPTEGIQVEFLFADSVLREWGFDGLHFGKVLENMTPKIAYHNGAK